MTQQIKLIIKYLLTYDSYVPLYKIDFIGGNGLQG
jgi:hypothetical protein